MSGSHPTPRPDDAALAALPKAELHVHLDGSLRPATMLELAEERGVALPARDADDLARHMVVGEAGSLEAYLARFDETLSVLQDRDALERVAYELVADHASEGVHWVEVRFCPALNTLRGLTSDQVVDAALRGVARGERDHGIRAGIIVCALRTHTPEESVQLAELALAYRDRGVCGFDLAGAEAGHPVRDHREAFDRAAAGGVPITIHAGEGFGPRSIREAVELGHARRIGHGTRLFEDPILLDELRARRIPLEVCLTSNVQTGVVPRLADHPARRYVEQDLPVVLGTDNRLMSGVTLTGEYARARDALGFGWTELTAIARASFEHAFAGTDEKAGWQRALAAFVESGTD